MQVMINIDEELLKNIKVYGLRLSALEAANLESSLKNSTSLPEEHGDLVDRDKLLDDLRAFSDGPFAMNPEALVKDASAVIESNKNDVVVVDKILILNADDIADLSRSILSVCKDNMTIFRNVQDKLKESLNKISNKQLDPGYLKLLSKTKVVYKEKQNKEEGKDD